MISKEVVQLIREIYAYYGKRDERVVKEDPEGLLICLLSLIKKAMEDSWSSDVKFTVESAAGDYLMKELQKSHGKSKPPRKKTVSKR